MNSAPDPFGGLPHFAERVRVGFEHCAATLDADALTRFEEEAVAVLHTMLALEEQGAPRKDEENENSAEFQRLERKLDLVIELLSARLLADTALPEHSVQFSAEGLRWACTDPPPPVGAAGVLTIYLHRLMPRPLQLPAVVHADVPGWVHLRFQALSDACEDLLVRYVFLQHRRKLAGSRRKRAP